MRCVCSPFFFPFFFAFAYHDIGAQKMIFGVVELNARICGLSLASSRAEPSIIYSVVGYPWYKLLRRETMTSTTTPGQMNVFLVMHRLPTIEGSCTSMSSVTMITMTDLVLQRQRYRLLQQRGLRKKQPRINTQILDICAMRPPCSHRSHHLNILTARGQTVRTMHHGYA